MARGSDSLNRGGHFLVQRQDWRFWSDWNDRVWVDLLVTHCVMALDVSEVGRVMVSWVVPVEVANPSAKEVSPDV